MLLNARSSAKVYNKAVETNSKFTSLISKSSVRITRETSIISQKIEGLVGGPLLVGGLRPGPPGPPLNPAVLGGVKQSRGC